jgi:type IV pilus assembly protein PilC
MILIEKLGALLKAKIPLITALDLLSTTGTPSDKNIIIAIRKFVSEGMTLSQAFEKFPQTFDNLTFHLIKAGEESASLTVICEHISNYQSKISQLKRRLKKALFYPILLFSISLIISIGLLVFIVPQFEQLFENAGTKLPFLTQIILSFSNFIQHNIFFILIFLCMLSLILYYARKRLLIFLIHIPLLGKILKKIMLSRFAYTLSVVLTAGIPLTKSLHISTQVLQHPHFEKALLHINESVTKGEKISEAFKQTNLFPPLLIQFLIISEQSSSLAFYLNKLAQVYDEETEEQLNTLTFLIEPLIMIILGLFIGGMIIAMYLPIFELGKVV